MYVIGQHLLQGASMDEGLHRWIENLGSMSQWKGDDVAMTRWKYSSKLGNLQHSVGQRYSVKIQVDIVEKIAM